MSRLPVINEADLVSAIEQLDGMFDLAALVSADVVALECPLPWWERGFASLLVEELALWAGELAQELRDVLEHAKYEAMDADELRAQELRVIEGAAAAVPQLAKVA